MKKYAKNFTKTVWGYAIVHAENVEEAKKKFDDGDIDDEIDNKSEYDFSSEIETEETK